MFGSLPSNVFKCILDSKFLLSHPITIPRLLSQLRCRKRKGYRSSCETVELEWEAEALPLMAILFVW